MDRHSAILKLWKLLSDTQKLEIATTYFEVIEPDQSEYLNLIEKHVAMRMKYRSKYFNSLKPAVRGRLLAKHLTSLPYHAIVEVVFLGLAVVMPTLMNDWGEKRFFYAETIARLYRGSAVSPERLSDLINDVNAKAEIDAFQSDVRILVGFIRATVAQSSLVDALVDPSNCGEMIETDRQSNDDASRENGKFQQDRKGQDTPDRIVNDQQPHPVHQEQESSPSAISSIRTSHEGQLTQRLSDDTGDSVSQRRESRASSMSDVDVRHDAFDRMIIREVVRAYVDTNSENNAELDQVLAALIRYQYDRPRVFFHLGFADTTVPGRVMTWTNPLLNLERRAWYLLGAFTGLLRRGERASAISLLNEKTDIFSSMTESPTALTRAATAWALYAADSLYELNQYDHLRKIIESEAIEWSIAGVKLLDIATRVINDCLAQIRIGDIESARLRSSIIRGCSFIDPNSRFFDEGVYRDFMYIEGMVLADARNFDAASEKFDALLSIDDGVEDEKQSEWYLGRAVCRLRTTSLWNLTIPSGPEAKTRLWLQLVDNEADFRASIDRDDKSGNAAIGLAMTMYLGWFLGRRESDSDGAEAKRLITSALKQVAHVETASEHQRHEVQAWLSLAMAVMLADSLDEDTDTLVPDYLSKAKLLGKKLPIDDLKKLIDGLSLSNPDLSADLVASLQTEGVEMRSYLEDVELLSRSLALREVARNYASTSDLSPERSWRIWFSLAKAYDSQEENQKAVDALNAMYAIALRGDRVPNTLEAFQRGGDAERIIGRSDTLMLYGYLLMSANRRVDGLSAFFELFHLLRSDSEDGARQLLDDLREYGFSREELSSLYQSLPAEASVKSVGESGVESEKSFSLLFVGGDERQERLQARLISELKIKYPNMKVHFIHPGWGTNYMMHYERAMQIASGCKAVVLMHFVRTNLGKLIRKNSPVPWFACNARGADGLYRSLLTAARYAASH